MTSRELARVILMLPIVARPDDTDCGQLLADILDVLHLEPKQAAAISRKRAFIAEMGAEIKRRAS